MLLTHSSRSRHARDTYTRRMEGVSLWVIPSAEIVASDPAQAGELFEPAADKIYRHPTFYDIPDEVKHHLVKAPSLPTVRPELVEGLHFL